MIGWVKNQEMKKGGSYIIFCFFIFYDRIKNINKVEITFHFNNTVYMKFRPYELGGDLWWQVANVWRREIPSSLFADAKELKRVTKKKKIAERKNGERETKGPRSFWMWQMVHEPVLIIGKTNTKNNGWACNRLQIISVDNGNLVRSQNPSALLWLVGIHGPIKFCPRRVDNDEIFMILSYNLHALF